MCYLPKMVQEAILACENANASLLYRFSPISTLSGLIIFAVVIWQYWVINGREKIEILKALLCKWIKYSIAYGLITLPFFNVIFDKEKNLFILIFFLPAFCLRSANLFCSFIIRCPVDCTLVEDNFWMAEIGMETGINNISHYSGIMYFFHYSIIFFVNSLFYGIIMCGLVWLFLKVSIKIKKKFLDN
jgi:hypothetical protein